MPTLMREDKLSAPSAPSPVLTGESFSKEVSRLVSVRLERNTSFQYLVDRYAFCP